MRKGKLRVLINFPKSGRAWILTNQKMVKVMMVMITKKLTLNVPTVMFIIIFNLYTILCDKVLFLS